MAREQFTVRTRDGRWFLDPAPQAGTLTGMVFTKRHETGRGPEECAYIEPCGGAPDGFWFPVGRLQALLDEGTVVPHFYDWDPERYVAINAEGIAFDVEGEPEGPEEERRFRRLASLGGHA